MVKRAKWLNATELAQLVERYEAGATTYDLAEQFGIGRETVANRLKAEGIKLRRIKLTEADLARAVELYATGLSTIKIGVMLNRPALDRFVCAEECWCAAAGRSRAIALRPLESASGWAGVPFQQIGRAHV